MPLGQGSFRADSFRWSSSFRMNLSTRRHQTSKGVRCIRTFSASAMGTDTVFSILKLTLYNVFMRGVEIFATHAVVDSSYLSYAFLVYYFNGAMLIPG